VTTRAVKERLHGLARDFDRLPDAAETPRRQQIRSLG